MLQFPSLDPVAIHLGPLGIRWYALAYIAGILLGLAYARLLHRRRPIPGLNARAMEDLLGWIVGGIILGGRLGYVLFYKPDFYITHPAQIFMVWQGGMSFHGGLIGVIVALFFFARRHGVAYFPLMDVAASATPIGLFFGRLANFVNGELFGRVTDAPWGMIFPNGGPLPRHPSQLYEAGMEGALLFALLAWLAFGTRAREKPGLISGVFLIGYASARATAECFREPDAFLGFILGPLTMGQLLCLPMLLLGVFLVLRACHVAHRPA